MLLRAGVLSASTAPRWLARGLAVRTSAVVEATGPLPGVVPEGVAEEDREAYLASVETTNKRRDDIQFRQSTPLTRSYPLYDGPDTEPPLNLAEINTLNDGVPATQQVRTVVIKQLARSVNQSSRGKTHAWTVKWKNPEDNQRWTNPLMGWTSSSDPLANLTLKFDTQEQAIGYCQRNSWNFEVGEPIDHARYADYGKSKYSYNFLSEAVEYELKKNGKKTKEFAQPGANESHYFRPPKYHGDGEVPQHGKNPDVPWK